MAAGQLGAEDAETALDALLQVVQADDEEHAVPMLEGLPSQKSWCGAVS
jgi:hypothetical protein